MRLIADNTNAPGETGMVLGTGKERPLSIAYPDGYPEARFESASLHHYSHPVRAPSHGQVEPQRLNSSPAAGVTLYSPWSTHREYLP